MSEISSLTGSPSTEQIVSQANQNLGKEDFLRLLTVQLRYQDPLNPMENTEFIAQMAQFSSLEQLQNMNQNLEQNLGSEQQLQTAFQNNLATSLVGRTVEIPTVEVDWDGENATQIGYRLDEGASSAKLQILDAGGRLVREFDLTSGASRGDISWDGASRFDSEVPEGAYRVLVLAQDYAGGRVYAEALKQVKVEAVRYDAKGATIWAGGQELSMEDLSGVIADN
jgi:flagellar basal-body rod modification protein FlgD